MKTVSITFRSHRLSSCLEITASALRGLSHARDLLISNAYPKPSDTTNMWFMALLTDLNVTYYCS